MAIQFPASPAVGQTFTPTAGVTYRWSGLAWYLIQPGAISSALIGAPNGVAKLGPSAELLIASGAPSQISGGLDVSGVITATGNITVTGGFVTTASTTNLSLATGGGLQAVIAHTASAVNYVSMSGGSAGSPPYVFAQGSDPNVGLDLVTKGTGTIRFITGNYVDNQVHIQHTPGSTQFVILTGSAGGNPTIGASNGTLGVSSNLAVSGTISATGDITSSAVVPGGARSLTVQNNSNAAFSDARVLVQTVGAGGGYPYTAYFDGAVLLTTGMDVADPGRAYVIGTNGPSGTPWAKFRGVGRLNLAGIPTSAAGLVTGDVWSNAGVLNIVP